MFKRREKDKQKKIRLVLKYVFTKINLQEGRGLQKVFLF